MVTSGSEDNEVKAALKSAGFKVIEAAGAGYKILTVICGLADAYVLSKNTTFKWDVCGPHAILKAMGGGIVNFSKVKYGKTEEINYSEDGICSESDKISRCCNSGGIIAYRDANVLAKLVNIFTDQK